MDQKIAIIGGALREQIVYDHLKAKGFPVLSYAMMKDNEKSLVKLEDCLTGADVLILPVRSNNKNLLIKGASEQCPVIWKKEYMELLKNGAPVFCGAASKELRDMAAETGHELIEIMEDDVVAVPNAELTAEGTLQYMMERSDVSLKDLRIAVFGYGRVGKACACLFRDNGCRVTVFCRNDVDIRHGREQGLDMRYYYGMGSVLPHADYVINTVPALIADEKVLSILGKQCRMIDLASAPGGIDFEAASRMGISAVLLPGIPGKYAPISAGNIIAAYYERKLTDLFGGDSV